MVFSSAVNAVKDRLSSRGAFSLPADRHVPQNVLYYLLFGTVFLLFCKISLDAVVYEHKRRAKGCGKIPRYPHLDPLLGLDVVLGMAKSLRQNYFLVWLNKIHENLPKTFVVNFVGTRFIYTIEPENMKAMSAFNWRDFAVGPMRRNNKATHPFADKGVNTVDGKEWEFSRFLIKPFFERGAFTNTRRLSRHVDRLLSSFPEDGVTFNIQPLVQRWVSSSRYISGKIHQN